MVLDTVADSILPYALRLDHPRCFGFVPSAPTWAGVVADFLAAGYNANTITWLVASGPNQLKLVVIDWIRGWMGYPKTAGGLLTSGGSAAALDGFVAARERAGHPEAGCLLVKDAATLEDAFAVPHDMLQDTIWGANHPNFSDRGLQHSRSFRALKIWISVQTYGMSAFRRAVSLGMELASRAERYIRGSPLLEILNPASLGIVCFG